MSVFESESGKRRLLAVEIPIIERYNKDRAEEYRIQVSRHAKGLLLRYRLKPMHNVYDLETYLPSSYPAVPPLTKVVTRLKMCPHLLEGQQLCMWRQGSTRETNRWDPAKFTCVFAVQAAWRWLACYEVWHQTGNWPLPDAN